MKPTKAWVVFDPQGEMLIGTLCTGKIRCIRNFVKVSNMVSTIQAWPDWMRLGYRCEQVVITKVKGRGK